MKILVVGDSYGLPRFMKDSLVVELKYTETYPEILRRLLVKYTQEDLTLVNHCKASNTTKSLVTTEASEILFLKPDFIIIQLGLADLWPCFDSKKSLEENYLEPLVEEAVFKSNLEHFIECADNFKSKVIVVDLPYIKFINEDEKIKNIIEKRMKRYREILFKVAKFNNLEFIELEMNLKKASKEKEVIAIDGIYLTAQGGLHIALLILTKILQMFCVEDES